MSDDERNEIMKKLHSRKSEKLLRDVMIWYHNDMGNGNLTKLVAEIEKHLEKGSEKTKQAPQCPNPVRS
jgi:hypothetical protein